MAAPAAVAGGALRGYQLEGLRFMVALHENRLNGARPAEATPGSPGRHPGRPS